MLGLLVLWVRSAASQASESGSIGPTVTSPVPSEDPEFDYDHEYMDEYRDDYDDDYGDWDLPRDAHFGADQNQPFPEDLRDESSLEDVFEVAPWVDIFRIVFFVALGFAGLGVGFAAARFCRGEAFRARIDADVDEPLILRVL
jgi:hypothetical protein